MSFMMVFPQACPVTPFHQLLGIYLILASTQPLIQMALTVLCQAVKWVEHLNVMQGLKVCGHFCCSVVTCDVMPVKHGDDFGLYLTLKNTKGVLDVIKDIGHDVESQGNKLYIPVS
jgi:hypothetical protein